MRLLFVARRYWPAVGGVESLLRTLARELATRHEVTVLAHRIDDGPYGRLTDSLQPPPSFEPFRDEKVSVVPLRIPLARRTLLAPLAAHVTPFIRRYAYGSSRVPAAELYARVVAPVIAREGPVDIVHMWGPDLLAAASVRAARMLDAPSVVTAALHPGSWGDDPASAAAYRSASGIVALLETEAVAYRGLGVANDRIAVLGGCSPGVEAGSGDTLRRQRGIDGPLVLFLGDRRPYKGIDLLLEAAATVPDVRFAFVGPGPALARPTANTLDIGLVDEAERAAWLDAADLLCLPSANESFGLVVLEAWSVGTPVLGSDNASLVEVIEGAGGGAVVQRDPRAIADKISAMLADPEALRRLGERGRHRWQEQYTPAVVGGKLEALYERLSSTMRAAASGQSNRSS